MTTIACSTTEMACDLQFTYSGAIKTKGLTKIWKIAPHELHYPEEFLVGFAGEAGDIIEIVDYFERPELAKGPPRIRGVSGLVLTASGKIFQFSNPAKWLALSAKYAAIGSGSPSAYGALHVGASPKEAILAASKVDPFTGMGTKVIKFK